MWRDEETCPLHEQDILPLDRMRANPRYQNPFVVKWATKPSMMGRGPYERQALRDWPAIWPQDLRWMRMADQYYRDKWKTCLEIHDEEIAKLDANDTWGRREEDKRLFRRLFGLQRMSSFEEADLRELESPKRALSDEFVLLLQDNNPGEYKQFLTALGPETEDRIINAMLDMIYRMQATNDILLLKKSIQKGMGLAAIALQCTQNYALMIWTKRKKALLHVIHRSN